MTEMRAPVRRQPHDIDHVGTVQRAEQVERPTLLRYTIGNGFSILLGLSICYGFLYHGGAGILGWDLNYRYAVGQMVLSGLGTHIYDAQRFHHFMLVHDHFDGPGASIYPPAMAMLFAALALLPYPAAYFLFLAANSFLLAASLWKVERYADLGRRASIALRIVLLTSLPVMVALLQGQISILLLALLLVVFSSLHAGQDARAGLALGLMCIKPQFIVPLIVLMLALQRYRALAVFVATASALALIPAIVFGPAIDLTYAHTMLNATQWGAGTGGFSPAVNRSFAGFAQYLLPHPWSALLTVLLDGAALGGLLYALGRRMPLDFIFALVTVTAILVGQHALIHSLTLLLVPTATLLHHRREYRAVWLLLGLLYVSVVAGFLISEFVPVQLPTIGMACVAGWLIVRPAGWRLVAIPTQRSLAPADVGSRTDL